MIIEDIKQAMKEQRVMYDALSEQSGIAKSTPCDFLNDKIHSLSAGKVAVIADVLDIPIEDMFTERKQ